MSLWPFLLRSRPILRFALDQISRTHFGLPCGRGLPRWADFLGTTLLYDRQPRDTSTTASGTFKSAVLKLLVEWKRWRLSVHVNIWQPCIACVCVWGGGGGRADVRVCRGLMSVRACVVFRVSYRVPALNALTGHSELTFRIVCLNYLIQHNDNTTLYNTIKFSRVVGLSSKR